MNILVDKKIESINSLEFKNIAEGFKSVILDIGTGDGRFVYKNAQKNPNNLFLGLDSTCDSMAEYASKVRKKPAKGGLNNVLYIVENAEALPEELANMVNKIYINLPWGSLRDGIIKGEDKILSGITNISQNNSTMEVCISYSDMYEQNEISKRELPELTKNYISTVLKERYKGFGIHITEISLWDNNMLKSVDTKWAKKLAFGRKRELYHFVGKVKK